MVFILCSTKPCNIIFITRPTYELPVVHVGMTEQVLLL